MSLSAVVEALVEAGATPIMILAAVRAYEAKEGNANARQERNRRYYEKRRAESASLKPSENRLKTSETEPTEKRLKASESVLNSDAPRTRVRDITLTSELTGEDNPSLRSDNSCGGLLIDEGISTALVLVPKPRSNPTDAVVAFDAYNAVAAELSLPVARSLSEPRRKALKRRLAEAGLEGWMEALDRLRRSPFCQGKTGTDFIASIDFLLQPKSFTKLLEGAYEPRKINGNGTHHNGSGVMAGGAHPRSGGRGPVDIGGIIIRRRAERGE